VDVYLPGPGGSQIHDLNPSSFPPVGLFWTTEVSGNGIDVELGAGRASLQATNVPILDYGNIVNALFNGNEPPPRPGTVSFRVVWSGINERLNIRNTDAGFAGEFIRGGAQMEWTAEVGDFVFVSDPISTSSSTFAEISHERNGSFFP